MVEEVPHPVLRLVVTEGAEMASLEQSISSFPAVTELLPAPRAGTSHQDRVGVVKDEPHGIDLVQVSVGDDHHNFEDQVRVRVQARRLHVDPKPRKLILVVLLARLEITRDEGLVLSALADAFRTHACTLPFRNKHY